MKNYWKHKYDYLYVEFYFKKIMGSYLFYVLADGRILILAVYLVQKSDSKYYTQINHRYITQTKLSYIFYFS